MSIETQKRPLEVILDSSFLFIPYKFKIDIFEALEKVFNRRFEPIVLSVTKDELREITKRRSPKLRKQAAFALKLSQKCHQMKVERCGDESHDDVIVRIASEFGYCVATNDRLLKRRLRCLSVSVVYLRQKSYLAVEGVI